MHEPTILLTGDTHGNSLKLSKFNYGGLTKEDYLIILGDFGFVFREGAMAEHVLDMLDRLPVTILFVDGNHENFNKLETYPEINWNGGKVGKVRDSILHLKRGEVFTIGSNTFFVMGGGFSIDKAWRKEGVSWWPQELPSSDEYENAIKNLDKVNCKVDYILTHSCSSQTLPTVAAFAGFSNDVKTDHLVDFLGEIERIVDYKHWYFGHYHIDIEEIVDKQTALYDLVKKLD